IDVARMMDVEPGDMLRCGRCRAFTICPWKRWNRRDDRRFEAARRAQSAQPIGDEYAVPWLATVRKQRRQRKQTNRSRMLPHRSRPNCCSLPAQSLDRAGPARLCWNTRQIDNDMVVSDEAS